MERVLQLRLSCSRSRLLSHTVTPTRRTPSLPHSLALVVPVLALLLALRSVRVSWCTGARWWVLFKRGGLGNTGEDDSLYVASLSESQSSYLLVTSRRASYPAQMATMASRLKTSDAVPVTCHCRNTMHRFVVSHVNSICEGEEKRRKC